MRTSSRMRAAPVFYLALDKDLVFDRLSLENRLYFGNAETRAAGRHSLPLFTGRRRTLADPRERVRDSTPGRERCPRGYAIGRDALQLEGPR